MLDWFFFFQAEDGIRDKLVTGVQTCALPISAAGSCCGKALKQPSSCQWPQLATQRLGAGDQQVSQLAEAGTPGSLRVFLCIGRWLGVVGDAVSEVDA